MKFTVCMLCLCLVCYHPKPTMNTKHSHHDFFLQLVRQQFDSDHSVEEKGFLFDTSGEGNYDPSITLEHTKITPEHWTITKEGCYRQV